MLDGLICVYRSNVDVFFYVIGSQEENELILVSFLNGLYDAFSIALKRNVEKKAILDNMDASMLILDEVCDDGVILETDSAAIFSRCAFKPDEIAFGDQSISQVGMSVSIFCCLHHLCVSNMAVLRFNIFLSATGHGQGPTQVVAAEVIALCD